MNGLHVVFGAAGGLGAAIVRKLAANGSPVRAVVRDAAKARRVLPAAEIIAADALIEGAVRAACRDALVVYHCINVPYHRWARILPSVNTNILDGARRAGARLLFAGNVYGYGRFQQIPATEAHPLAARTKKGKLRNHLERTLLEAHRAGEVRAVIPRMPDFYGPNVTNKLYGGLFEAALAGKRAMWMGKADVPHDLLYIDDAAAACVRLAAHDVTYGEAWHVPGAGPVTGRQFAGMVFSAAGKKPRLQVVGKMLMRLAGLFDSQARELVELMYEFEEPLILDGTKFQRAFPSFQFTPHEEAVTRTLEWFRARRPATR